MNLGERKQNCCGQCPYARKTSKEYLDTRGDNGEAFVGQANSASLLPCHMTEGDGIADPNRRQPQCAGAAKFRANVGMAERLEQTPLGRLQEDHEAVFSTNAELLAHHKGWPRKKAELYIRHQRSVAEMAQIERVKAVMLHRVKRIDS